MKMSMSMPMKMSMSMSMSMPMTMPVQGASGEIPGQSTQSPGGAPVTPLNLPTSTNTTQAITPTQTPHSVPLQPLNSTKTDSKSSGARVVVGLSGLVGFMGMLLF
jgi:hypothetical protein